MICESVKFHILFRHELLGCEISHLSGLRKHAIHVFIYTLIPPATTCRHLAVCALHHSPPPPPRLLKSETDKLFFFKALFFLFPCLEVNLFQKSKIPIDIDSTEPPPTRKGGDPPPQLVPQFGKVLHVKEIGLLQKLELHHTGTIAPLPPPSPCLRTPYDRASCLALQCRLVFR